LDLHQVWDTKVRAYDNTVPPGRSDLVRYRFRIPPDTKGEITITARVNYRRFRRGFTNFVFGRSAEFPVVEMASQSFVLKTGENISTATTDAHSRLLRWNNYGIALLEQQQYWLAVEAFQKTLQIDPKYADGYVNIAIAEYSKLVGNKKENPDGPGNLSSGNITSEKFDVALKRLDQALQIAPDYPRALYYKALVLRFEQHWDSAIELQKKLVINFPRLRQARQQLGYLYYLEKKYGEAREQFEGLQAINPDDLTAHYYLSLIYEKVGMKDKAEQEAAAYAEHRDDPTVAGLAQDFWRRYPAVADELAPYHVHESAVKRHYKTTIGGPLP
jgi:tetratricopeptide (TPR) repeat protein